jgi:hypothetical protein
MASIKYVNRYPHEEGIGIGKKWWRMLLIASIPGKMRQLATKSPCFFPLGEGGRSWFFGF